MMTTTKTMLYVMYDAKVKRFRWGFNKLVCQLKGILTLGGESLV